MAYPIPEIPKELFGNKLTVLEMFTYGIARMENAEAFFNEYAKNSGQGCNGIIAYLGFTPEEAKMFIQYMYPLERIVEKRRKIIYESITKNNLPF